MCKYTYITLKRIKHFPAISQLFPLGNRMEPFLHMNKLEYAPPKNALFQVWLKLAKQIWRRFLNFVNVFSLFLNYLRLEKGWALHLNKLESLSPKDSFY